MSQTHAALLVATLGACQASPSSLPIASAPARAASLADALERARTQHGDVLLVSADDGITAYSPELAPLVKLTTSPGRYLHADPQHRALYYFLDRRLVRLDLGTGQELTIATLPELRHVCFGQDSQAVSPLDYVQREQDIVVDVALGVACLTVQDRNINMMSVSIAYRIALDTGVVVQKVTSTLEECREPGEPEAAEAPCEAGGLMAEPGRASPSKRWELVRDPDLGEQGDYIYSATLVTEPQTRKTYAIRADGIAEIDLAAAQAAHAAPDGTCVLPYEALVRWFPHVDVALVVGCTDSGALLVRPPATVRTLAGKGFAFY